MAANYDEHIDEVILEWILAHTSLGKAFYFAWSILEQDIKFDANYSIAKIDDVADVLSRTLVRSFVPLLKKHKGELRKYQALNLNGECRVYNIHTHDQVTKDNQPITKWRLILKDLRNHENIFSQNFEL